MFLPRHWKNNNIFFLIRKLGIQDIHAPTREGYYNYCISLLYICFYLVIFHEICLIILGRY